MAAILVGTIPAAFLHLRAGPEVGGGLDTLVGGGDPQGLPEPPLGFMRGHGEVVAGDWVGEVVVDDAVGGRVEAGGDGVVIGERERGEDGDEARGGGGAIADEAVDVRGRGLVLVPEAEPVGGDEDHHRLLELHLRPRGGRRRRRGGEGRAGEDEEEVGGRDGERGGEEEVEAGGGGGTPGRGAAPAVVVVVRGGARRSGAASRRRRRAEQQPPPPPLESVLVESWEFGIVWICACDCVIVY